jgi:hypothetical protein
VSVWNEVCNEGHGTWNGSKILIFGVTQKWLSFFNLDCVCCM